MFFLVIDDRFSTPIHVFLEVDPRGVDGYPGLYVREVAVDVPAGGGDFAVGQDPRARDHFRVFASDRAVAGAGFVLIEPRYVGPTWESYGRVYNPQGGKVRQRDRAAGRAKSGGARRGGG